MEQVESPQSADLCTACGLCCAGPLFNRVDVALEELMQAINIGIRISADHDVPHIAFPCTKLVNRRCSVYQNRPTCCHDFRCETLKQLDREEITLETGLERVAEALQRAETANLLLHPETIPAYRQRRFQAREDGKALPSTEAHRALQHLDEILDEHFRRPEARQNAAYAEIEKSSAPGT